MTETPPPPPGPPPTPPVPPVPPVGPYADDGGPGRSRTALVIGVVVALVVVAAVVVGIVVLTRGGDDSSGGGSPSASKADFCSGLQTFQGDFSSIDPTKDTKGYVAKLKAAARTLQSTGTPSDMPADAHAGWLVTIQEILKVPDDATLDDLSKLGDDLSDADQAKITALNSYIDKECPGLSTSS